LGYHELGAVHIRYLNKPPPNLFRVLLQSSIRTPRNAFQMSAEFKQELIEIESGSCYSGSDYDTDYSDTTSLSSTLYEYTYENGRRYGGPHAEKYMLPNDQKEEGRLDLRHHLWNLGL